MLCSSGAARSKRVDRGSKWQVATFGNRWCWTRWPYCQSCWPESVIALTEGVLKTMFLKKLKTSLAVLLMLGFLGVGAGSWTYQTQAARPGKAQAGAEPKAEI